MKSKPPGRSLASFLLLTIAVTGASSGYEAPWSLRSHSAKPEERAFSMAEATADASLIWEATFII